MQSNIDVFKIERDGAVLWRCTADSMHDAHARVKEFSAEDCSEYLIFDLTTGEKISVPYAKPEHARAAEA